MGKFPYVFKVCWHLMNLKLCKLKGSHISFINNNDFFLYSIQIMIISGIIWIANSMISYFCFFTPSGISTFTEIKLSMIVSTTRMTLSDVRGKTRHLNNVGSAKGWLDRIGTRYSLSLDNKKIK
jgi:hypothetical protein